LDAQTGRKTPLDLVACLGWLALAGLCGAYIAGYAAVGIESNDTGFIMGLAHQLALKARLYDDVIYVRPPVSPWLHSLFFHGPFASAPLYWDRCFVFLQLAASAALGVLTVAHRLAWRPAFAPWVACLAFVVAAHNFPAMAWHTLDGVFFSALALCLCGARLQPWLLKVALASAAAWLAAGAKQPFYLTPLLVAAWCVIEGRDAGQRVLALAAWAGSLLLWLAGLSRVADVHAMWSAISAQTTGQDLWAAGIQSYWIDLSRPYALLGAWPLLGVLVWGLWRQRPSPAAAWSLLAISGLSWALCWRWFRAQDIWGAPYFMFDAAFVFTALSALVMWWRTRSSTWGLVWAMHAVAWASSISWGYCTVMLFVAPVLITLAHVLHEALPLAPAALRWVALLSLPAALLTFWEGHRLYFSGELALPRAELTEEMPGLGPSMRHIRTAPVLAERYNELIGLVQRYPGPFVALPNMPLAHTWAGQPNPIGIDWPMNAEVGPALPRVRQRLNARVAVAFVGKDALRAVRDPGKFGSQLTVDVVERWRLIGETAHFLVYANPQAPQAGVQAATPR